MSWLFAPSLPAAAQQLSGPSLNHYSLDAQPAAFSISGQTASLLKGSVQDAQPASFALSGQDAALTVTPALQNYEIDAQPAAFSVAGVSATILRDASLNAAVGSLAISGTAASELYGRNLDAQPAALTVTGQAATLQYTRALSVDAQPAAFALGGQAASPLRGLQAAANAGAFALVGSDASFTRSLELSAAAGSFAVSGQDATFTYSVADPILDANPTAFTVTGADAELLVDHVASADAGVFSVSGQSAAEIIGRGVIASAGAYSYTGSDADLRTVRLYAPLDAQPGAFTVSGSAATGLRNYVFTADAGGLRLSRWAIQPYVEDGYADGLDAILAQSRSFVADSTGFVISGRAATLSAETVYPPPQFVREGVTYGPGGAYVGTMKSGRALYLFDD